MRLSQCALGVLAGVALVVPSTRAYADASLLLSKKGAAGTTSFSVPAGGSFDLSVTLLTTPNGQTPAPQVTGVDYFLKSTLGAANASGIFTLSSIDLTSSVFQSYNSLSFNSTVLNPISPDVGSGETDVTQSVSGGPLEVADFHVLVSPGAAVGSTYKLAIADNGTSTLGYAGPSPSFTGGSLINNGSLLITVAAAVPEPASALAVGSLAGVLIVRRRRGC